GDDVKLKWIQPVTTVLGVWLLSSVVALAQPATQKLPPNYGTPEWLDSDRGTPPGMQFKTFSSETAKGEVSYLVYLPPDYEKDAGARFPVLYQLPSSGSTPKRDCADIVRRVDAGIRSGKLGPMIIIGVNGLRGNTMYCD